jgi:hypothetical protein
MRPRRGTDISNSSRTTRLPAGNAPIRPSKWENSSRESPNSRGISPGIPMTRWGTSNSARPSALHISIFNESRDDWQVAPGDYKFWVGGSSRSLPLSASVNISE